MKLSLISSSVVLISLLSVVGCSSNKGVAPAPQAPVAVAPMPVPAPEATPEQPAAPEEPEVTADGRVVVKGDVWELDVPLNQGWRKIETDKVEFAMMNRENPTLVLLNREEFVKPLADFVKKEIKEFKDKQNGSVVLQKDVEVNGRKAVYFEVKMKDVRAVEWAFTTGAEGFGFMCGGPEAAWAVNKVVCADIAAHFYLGGKK